MEEVINEIENNQIKPQIMKTQNTKLVFGKSSITELNDQQIKTVMGGTTYVCSNCIPDPISDKLRTILETAN